jgi:hypothetical protein
MYYRIYQDSTQVYPVWGYNLTYSSLKKMAQWYLKSLFYQEILEDITDGEALNFKLEEINSYSENEVVDFIKNYLSGWDGNLDVESKLDVFDPSECDEPELLTNNLFLGSKDYWN